MNEIQIKHLKGLMEDFKKKPIKEKNVAGAIVLSYLDGCLEGIIRDDEDLDEF